MIIWQPGRTLDDIEKEVILKALGFYQGNKTHTARSLGIAIRTLDNKLAKYNGMPIEEEPVVASPPPPIVSPPKGKK